MDEETTPKTEKLPEGEVGRRVAAGRVLRGYNSRKAFMAEIDEAKSVPPNRIKDVEEGNQQLEQLHVDAIAEFLRLPRAWFTEPLEKVIPWELPRQDVEAAAESLDKITRQIATLQEQVQRFQRGWMDESIAADAAAIREVLDKHPGPIRAEDFGSIAETIVQAQQRQEHADEPNPTASEKKPAGG